MRRKLSTVLMSLVLIMSMLSCGLASAASVETVRQEDDFYEAVNGAWFAKNEIPPDRVSIGGFMDLTYEVQDLLIADFTAMLSGEAEPDTPEMAEFLKYYTMATDYEARNAQGADPLAPYLTRIEVLENLADYGAVLDEWVLDTLPAPFGIGLAADMMDAETYAVYAMAPSTFLPDSSYYQTEMGDQLLAYFEQILAQLLEMAGFPAEEAATIAAQAIEFDSLVAPYIKSAEESSDYTDIYNPVSFEEFAAYSDMIDFRRLVNALVGSVPEKIIVTDPEYYAVIDSIVNDDTFELMKSWMTATTVYSLSSYLSEDMMNTAMAYSMIWTGQTDVTDPMEAAYSIATSVYGGVVGDYYGRTYFGEEAKADVEAMIERIVEVFVSRLSANTWLGEDTLSAAITKLNSLSVKVGYPDELDPLYSLMVISDGDEGNLLDTTMGFVRIIMEDNFTKYGTEVDQDEWAMTADTVNAYYDPMENSINFPAAILQAPFYSLEQTDSQNYGGIGAVIAHEITHAFDPSGSKFDEHGNLNDWWTEEDRAAFDELSQAMLELFDGMEFGGGTVNGQLTLSENIADAGGLSCALEAVSSLPDADLTEFFTNWATIWQMKSTTEYEQLLLVLDAHAPNKLRANVQLMNLDSFHDTFGIAEGDGMYLPPEERISIW